MKRVPSIFLTLAALLAGTAPADEVRAPAARAARPCALDDFAANGASEPRPGTGDLPLDGVISEALRSVAATPGLAVGIVEQDRVIYARGFGRRDLEGCEPVTEATAFYLLSVTKSLTGMAAALLQEEGAVELDRPLTDFFQGLSMPAPINPAQTSLRDLLLHRPGFWSGGINYRSFAPGNLDDEALLDQLRNHARPSSIEFVYSNLGYVVAGAALEEATGAPWEKLLEEKVFRPAGMSGSTTSIAEAQEGDFARPYAASPEGGFEARPVKVQAQMHAAGGAVSTVRDLLRWIRLNLRQGRIDGEAVFPRKAVRQALAPQIRLQRAYGPYQRYAYGLGVYHADLEGEWTVHHFGGPIHVSFQPDRDRGLVILSAGTDSTAFVHELGRLIYRILDRDGGEVSVEDYFREIRDRLQTRLEERRAQRAELAARSGSLARPVEAYAGTYRSDRLGEILLSSRGGSLHLKYGVFEQALLPLEADTFLADLLPGDGELTILEYRDGEEGPALFWGERRFGRLEPKRRSP